jgi:catechol 2,3-dioxygenase-like lactoylglutathione lyase family enzyme
MIGRGTGMNARRAVKMARHGVHHVGFATHDAEATIKFYTEKLGWEFVLNDVLRPGGGGHMRHMFFDSGDGSFFAFLCPKDVPGIPANFPTNISSAVGVPLGFYHVALWVDDVEALAAKRDLLLSRGVKASLLVDHDFCTSFYFEDPNGIQLEYCATNRPFNESDKDMNSIGTTRVLTDDPVAAQKVLSDMMSVAAVVPETEAID